MYDLGELPPQGIPLMYRFKNGKYHRAVIDSGYLITYCGKHATWGANWSNGDNMLLCNPLTDSITTMVTPYQGQLYRCQRCR